MIQFPKLLAALLAALTLGSVNAEEGERDFKPRTVIPRAFPPIVDAPFLSVAQAGDKVEDDELVLGIVVNGEAKAYPINQLKGPRREIINDSLGGRRIAATW